MNVLTEVAVTSGSSGSVTSDSSTVRPPAPAASTLTDAQELNNLSQIIKTWRELNKENTVMKEQVREKTKRMKALEEMILRIMKKNNIGALDLKGSGGRLLYRRQTSKGTLNVKCLTDLLTQHLKSETAATDALKFINENRGAKVRESLLYEKEM
jgi:hypothetical protein